jgi:hypothetical protein
MNGNAVGARQFGQGRRGNRVRFTGTARLPDGGDMIHVHSQ